jgi:demethylmenaquinone methyltransferase/2-methoxy-6-polyprenyl-1,4-benzoquinol methylase
MKEPALVDYYSRRAREYERIYHKPERQEDLGALHRLVTERLADRDVLEIACGTGYWTEAIAPAARSVMATDASETAMGVARQKTYPEGRVRFTAADAFHPAAVEGRFTALFAGFFWSHVPRSRLPDLLRGWSGRLGPGQRMLFIDNRYVEGSSTPVAGSDADGNTYQVRRLDDGSEHRVMKNFPDEDELRQTIAPIAEVVEIEMLTHYWLLSATSAG